MELKEVIEKLLASGMIDNQELGTTLMKASDMSDEEKKIHIDKFIEDYRSNKIDFFDEERKNLLRLWIEIYEPFSKQEIKNRVKKIT